MLRRFDPQSDGGRAAARVQALADYDALHLSGAFTGASSGAAYFDLRCDGAPELVTDRYYSLNVSIWFDG